MAVDPVQAGGAARHVVGLLLDREAEPRLGGTRGKTVALVLVLGARQGND